MGRVKKSRVTGDSRAGIQAKRLTPEVFAILTQAKDENTSMIKACEKAGIAYNTFKNWLSDPKPTGMVERLQEAFKLHAITQRAQSKPDLEQAALDAATTTRIEETIEVVEVMHLTKSEYAALEALGDEALMEKFDSDGVILKRTKKMRTILPDGSLAERMLRRQEQKEQEDRKALEKIVEGGKTAPIAVVHPSTPDQ